jgi:hypothetical protein
LQTAAVPEFCLPDKRLLKVVPLSSGGRAVGVTLESIIDYQRDVMSLQPLHDEDADRTAEAAEQAQRSTP